MAKYILFYFVLKEFCVGLLYRRYLLSRDWHLKLYSVIAVSLCYVFALLYNLLTLWRNFIAVPDKKTVIVDVVIVT
jgi:hypothetical protein